MLLWTRWREALSLLRPAFSHTRTFLWFSVSVAGLSVRTDHLGVTSIVRALSLDGCRDFCLLNCCHSKAIDLRALARLWSRAVLALFGERVERVDGRIVLVADGKKIAKAGRRMPGVKSLHQESESNRASQVPSPRSSWAIPRRRSRCWCAPRARCSRFRST